MIEENNIIRNIPALLNCFFSAQAGIHLYPVTAQNPFRNHKVHLFIIYGQHSDTLT